ncbi:hypothetical protein TrST_g13782 [Triparma strigata]|uniref:GST N-terminal domain-containing protein n=1 Tax=Triparma strigata TaxID=1606541 RepID=A0A9W7APN0_9STRA|nr:hypothetical protein TrST_g13782 [Triparma strigata]
MRILCLPLVFLLLSELLFVAASSPTDASCSSTSSSDDTCSSFVPSYSLTYFDGRGLAEVARTLFYTTNTPFTDIRLSNAEFRELKRKNVTDLSANLGRLPLLNHSGFVLGQSASINRYLAHQLSIFGSNPSETALIDSIVEHILDMKAAYKSLLSEYDTESDTEFHKAVEEWHSTPPSPLLPKKKNRQLRWYLSFLEKIIPPTGYSVGTSPSLSDAYIFNLLFEFSPSVSYDTERGRMSAGHYFGNYQKTMNVLEEFPNVKKVCITFRDGEGMKRYLDNRGEIDW